MPCPRCKSPTQPVPTRQEVENQQSLLPGDGKNSHLEVLLDNIRSTFNVGAMLRTSDGAGVHHVHLSGITPQPDHPRIAKVSLGAEYAVPWTYHANGLEAARQCKTSGLRILALELDPNAVSLFDLPANLIEVPSLLVVGNEVAGIDPGILELCDTKIFIPMQGYKRSLNVAVAFGIAVYTLRFGLNSVGISHIPSQINALQ